MVVGSFKDDPVQLREPKYRPITEGPIPLRRKRMSRIALVINDRHEIHHVRERGYVESPVRISAILKELDQTDLFVKLSPKRFPQSAITDVHDKAYVKYFKNMSLSLEAGISIYPYVFPIRNSARPPEVLAVRAGYYCIDTFTPLNRNAFLAARRGVDCTLTAAQALLEGFHLSYALVRPPGHHAEMRSFGGFCYFNTAAVAAHYLSRYGRIAILDIDHHHGNGQQQIFYDRDDVLTVSIHGHPRFAYPYFSGFEDEMGNGPGKGFNRNYPLPETITPRTYIRTCARALKRIAGFDPHISSCASAWIRPAETRPAPGASGRKTSRTWTGSSERPGCPSWWSRRADTTRGPSGSTPGTFFPVSMRAGSAVGTVRSGNPLCCKKTG
jgi:acetoin utilization deacetylase AcuC-like enzyme